MSLRSLFMRLPLVSISILFGALILGCTSADTIHTTAERNARAYAQSLGLTIEGVTCSGADSDQDGYTSCTLNEGAGKLQAIECGYDQAVTPLQGQNTQCKIALPKTRVVNP